MKNRIVLVLLVLSFVMGLASGSVTTVDTGTDSGEATVSLPPAVEVDTGSGSGEATTGPAYPPSIVIVEPEVSLPPSIVTVEPEVSIPDGGNGDVVDPVVGGYKPVSVAVLDPITPGGDAVVGIPVLVGEVQPPDVWIPEVQPPDVWIPEVQPPDVWIPEQFWIPEQPPEAGTCEFPGHPPCSPDVWIIPQWMTQWFPWRFA